MQASSAQRRRTSPSLLSQRQRFAGSIGRFWQSSYAPEYLALTVIFILLILLEFFAVPFHRMFSLDDLSIQYPHAQVERVSPGWLIIYAGAIPLAIFFIWSLVARPDAHKIHVTFLGFFISTFSTILLTDLVKNAVGRPRPDLIARCIPKPRLPPHKLITIAACTQRDAHTLHDGWRSFPSGHSSLAFAGLFYLSLFAASQLHAARRAAPLPAQLLCALPTLAALGVAVSRLQDYRHGVWDVLVGIALGALVAWASWRRYYPPLAARECDNPWPSRREVAVREAARRLGKDVETGVGEADEGEEEEEESRGMLRGGAGAGAATGGGGGGGGASAGAGGGGALS